MDTNKIKKGLGRGLSSLIGETKAEIQKNRLSVSDLVPNKYQPRKIFDEENLNELANSIKERGILQPIIVRKSKENKSKFEIAVADADFETVAAESNYEVRSVSSVKELDENIPGLGAQPAIVRWAFEDSSSEGDFKSFNTTAGGFVVVC